MRRAELLLVANAPSENTRALAAAVLKGAAAGAAGILARRLPPLEAEAADVIAARAIIIGTTENFGYMSGQIKDFFERVYYPCLEKTAAKPWALYVRAGKDGTGANRAAHSIVAGLKWREAQPPLLLVGEHRPSFAEECECLGMTIAAGLEAGLF